MDGRAPLVTPGFLPLQQLVLDPGDELAAVDEPELGTDPAFLMAFVPLRSYQRLAKLDLSALTSSIVRNPGVMEQRVLVRPLFEDRYIVIDGMWHVAALRKLVEDTGEMGVDLPDDVQALAQACPVRMIAPDTDPAFVLSLLDAPRDSSDQWYLGQRDRLLRQLAQCGRHRSTYDVAVATGGSRAAMRKYHAYRALEQFLQQHPLLPADAARVFPFFHVAMARTVVRSWLDWDDHLCEFLDDEALEVFYRLLLPDVDLHGRPVRACITSIEEVVHLCDVLETQVARRALVERGATLAEAMRVVEDNSNDELMARVSEAIDSIRWDQQRFRNRF